MTDTQDKNYIIALDQGTTSSRAIIFDRDANVVGTSQREFAQHYPQAGWVEHDPMEIFATQSAMGLHEPLHAQHAHGIEAAVYCWMQGQLLQLLAPGRHVIRSALRTRDVEIPFDAILGIGVKMPETGIQRIVTLLLRGFVACGKRRIPFGLVR